MLRKTLPLSILLATTAAHADLSANIGWQSDYVYRGIPQATSSAQGGVDYETDNFYLGTWAADVGQGAEIDLYGGFTFNVGDVSLGIGGTGYFYTDNFDDTYTELNLSAGFGPVTLDYADGTYDNISGPELDYGFISATFEHESGFYGVIGSFSKDFDGSYYQVGYGTGIGEFDVSVDWIYSDEDLMGGSSGDNSLVFSLGKSFAIGD